jgi:hypothetical protein
MKRIFAIAALATLATAAKAQDNNAASSTTSAAAPAASSTTVAAANGQSTTVVADPEAAATAGKAWSISFVNLLSADAKDANYRASNQTFSTDNYVGAGYKLDAKNRLGFRQYFSVDHSAETGEYTRTMNDPVLTYTRNMDGVLKSDPISAMFWYYIPTSDVSRDARSNGQVRLDMEFAYTLTPKWSVSYYLNPRQNFIPTNRTTAEDGTETLASFSKTTLIHYGNLYYNFSDTATAYTYVGYKHRWQTSTATLNEESLLTAVGAYFTLAGGKIQLNPEVSAESMKVSNFQKVASGKDIQEKNLSYALTSAFSF